MICTLQLALLRYFDELIRKISWIVGTIYFNTEVLPFIRRLNPQIKSLNSLNFFFKITTHSLTKIHNKNCGSECFFLRYAAFKVDCTKHHRY